MAELKQENLPENNKAQRCPFTLDYHKFQKKKLFSSRQKRDRTRLALPRFCHFSGPPMQGYTHR